jgi:hypothetical protein
VELPAGWNFEKFERKALKLKDCLELELEERAQVDNVINFFTDTSKKFLDDDDFYKLDQPTQQATSSAPEVIDPANVMDDLESNFALSQAANQIVQSSPSHGIDSQSQKSNSVYPGFGVGNKGKMSQQALAAFMKAKLSKTKISSDTKTAKCASGSSK